ncbi:hypothetical protein PGT21_000188 [Puccinia graminis f. sp. tritici]|uniref:Uncharacterized protein n=1 Tax=Puccinia graminis f. sp. tritici TaxID=56615 RepID=A0A5B0N0H4_PUCGR|nr:hypothetical protein PGT21_000188 [Puccinia graminis f. sp. tritici]
MMMIIDHRTLISINSPQAANSSSIVFSPPKTGEFKTIGYDVTQDLFAVCNH